MLPMKQMRLPDVLLARARGIVWHVLVGGLRLFISIVL